jgi:hypothetical protein
MEKYREKLLDIIEKQTGTRDVMSLNYKELTKDMDKDSFDNSLTRGSINLIAGRIKTPAEVNKIREHFINTPLP